jgi:hypothetical protein
MKTSFKLALAATAMLASASAAFAHHSFSMFDPAQEVVVQGKVVRWAFTSPHTFMIMEDAEGVTWAFEGSAPPALIGRNMVGDTFAPGQEITMVMCPLRDGRNGGAAGIIITEDGTVYNPADGGCPGPNRNAEKWPEWIAAGHTSLAEAQPTP